jgi:acetylxylan esterase
MGKVVLPSILLDFSITSTMEQISFRLLKLYTQPDPYIHFVKNGTSTPEFSLLSFFSLVFASFHETICTFDLSTMFVKFLLVSLSILNSVLGAANPLVQVTNFGTNPTNVGFYLYVPTKLQTNPPILVNPHACHGSAQDAFTGTQLATLADTYGYIMIFPNSPNTADYCWDVSSTETLTHNGGGDSLGIVSMVKYTLSKYNGDANRVFSMGTSSGAMMTNVLMGSYPDVFAAGSAWAGVAFGCFAGNGYDVWNSACADGTIIKTGAQWEAIVDAAYPGYTGFRPKVQVFHGTADTTLNPQNLQEEIKEWTAVLGLPSSPVSTLTNNPESGWTTYIYGDKFHATSAQGVTHNIQTNESVVLSWFDLTCQGSTGGCYSRTSTASSGTGSQTTTLITSVVATSTLSSASALPSADIVAKYGQCGGEGYVGPTTCVAGTTCTAECSVLSECPYFLQCL